MSENRPIANAIAALRLGRPITVEDTGRLTVISAETGSASLKLLDPNDAAPLLISGRRAAALSLGNTRDAADPDRPVLLARTPWLNAENARALADPGEDMARAPIGPLQPLPIEEVHLATAALQLARMAGLLPALWVLDQVNTETILSLQTLRHEQANPEVMLVARARLPVEGIHDTQMAAFRSADGREHAALLIGAFGGKPPLVRLHSECLTGDVFGSLKCDCGPQLKEAIRIIAAEGGGILLYLRQEGRGIGLANKLRAYALQDRGLDTVEANERLGFADDERDYAAAAAMLRALGVDRVRLLTNNPAKMAALEDAGVGVVERVGHAMPANPHNADYLAVKRRKSGHLF